MLTVRLLGVSFVTVLGAAACGGDSNLGMQPGPTDMDSGTSIPDAGVTPDTGVLDAEPPPPPPGLAILGQDTHVPDQLAISEVATAADGLASPRDVAIHPTATNQLWIASHANDTMVIVFDYSSDTRSSVARSGFGAVHFMPKPAALAFGQPGFLSTIHEEDGITQPQTPEDFMGPSLWTDDIRAFDGGHESHYDMLHNSPNGAGIAWERDNVYWVADGFHGSVTRYDFGRDHGPAGTDHSDGIVARYCENQFLYVEGVSSHLEVDLARNKLYLADTGNMRVAALDLASGTRGANIGPNYDGGQQYRMDGAMLTTLIDTWTYGMERPSGLALHDDLLFVSDNASSKIFAFDLEGTLIDYLDLSGMVEMGSLAGLTFDAEGSLYIADSKANRVLRISPPPPRD